MATLSRAEIEAAARNVQSPKPTHPVVFERLLLMGIEDPPNLQGYLSEYDHGYTEAVQAAMKQLLQLIEERGTEPTWRQVAVRLLAVEHCPQTAPVVIIVCEWEEYLRRLLFEEGWNRGHGRFKAAVLSSVKPADESEMIHILA